MKFNPIPGVPRDRWLCNAPPAGGYAYLDAHGHLLPLELPGMIVTDTVDDHFCLNIEVSFAGRIMGRAVTLDIPPGAPLCMDPLGCGEAGDMIVLLPQSAWAKTADNGITPPDRILTTVSERGGRFEFRGLPPGDYKVYALRDVDPEIVYHPDFSTVFGTPAMRVLYNFVDSCEDPALRRAPGHDLSCEVMRPSMNDLELLVDRLYQ
jgi:hypothetical protein